MIRVGLTGGVASGKSTVASLLAEQGAVVIDADVIAREVVAKGSPGLARVVEEFGSDLLTPDGELDRPAMGRLVFADEGARRRLEAIVHPLVHAEIAAREQAAAEADEAAVVVHDIPLLVEGGPDRRQGFDEVLVVDVPQETQVERMVGDRGWAESDALSRIRAQASREDRRAVATYVLDNTGTREDLRDRVAEVFEEIVTRRS